LPKRLHAVRPLDGHIARSLTLGYARAGWQPFPCKPASKEPATVHGFKDGNNSPERIRAWWTECSEYNIAIPTGSPGPDVLDIDVREQGSGWAALNQLKRAGLLTGARALIRTPGGGLHVYFAGSDQPSGRLPQHFVDFKARGGYVLVPPSAVDGKPYALLDHRTGTSGLDWQAVRRLLDSPRPRRSRSEASGDIGALVEWVARRQPGDRNHPLFWAAREAARAGQLDDGAVERFVDAAIRAGLRGGEPEARRSIASAARGAAR
jgi:hypothetical protein